MKAYRRPARNAGAVALHEAVVLHCDCRAIGRRHAITLHSKITLMLSILRCITFK